MDASAKPRPLSTQVGSALDAAYDEDGSDPHALATASSHSVSGGEGRFALEPHERMRLEETVSLTSTLSLQ